MKKYKVTETHPGLKVGVEIWLKESSRERYEALVGPVMVSDNIREDLLRHWERESWIEEIQEPEYTERDLVKYATACIQVVWKDRMVVHSEIMGQMFPDKKGGRV